MKKLIFISLVFSAIFLTACADSVTKADSLMNSNSYKGNEEPIKVTLCDLKKNPADYNHKLVEITGFFSHRFEDSTVDEPSCPTDQCIWHEYGGKTATGTTYCCGVSPERTRSEEITVENIQIPLVEDENFQTFDNYLQKSPDVTAHATVIGRFFSGEKEKYRNGTEVYNGFGHFGMCSLLMIQKVVSVSMRDDIDLDDRASDYYQPELEKVTSYEYLDVDSSKDAIELQQKADAGERDWSFNDSQRVAVEAIARFAKTDPKTINNLKKLRETKASIDYKWKDKKKDKEYVVVVSRPYWLSFYAKDPKKVAWVITAAYKIPADEEEY